MLGGALDFDLGGVFGAKRSTEPGSKELFFLTKIRAKDRPVAGGGANRPKGPLFCRKVG